MVDLPQRRRVLSVAWVGHGNFGDEAIAFALRSALRARGFSAPVYYQAGRWPIYRAMNEDEAEVLHRPGRVGRVSRLLDPVKLRQFDTVMIGGGSLFKSEFSLASMQEIVRRVRQRHGARAFVACIGVSAGPFESLIAERRFGEFAHAVDCFILRDSRSAELVRATGTAAEVVSAMDLSFSLPAELGPRLLRRDPNADSAPIGLSFVRRVGDASFETDGRFDLFLELINRILADGRRVALFTLYLGPSYSDDALNARLARESAHPERVTVHRFDGGILRTANEIAKCGSLLSTRLHGLIFAYLSGVPFVSLGEDPKNRQFCNTVRYPARFVFDLASRPPADVLAAAVTEAAHAGADAFKDALLVKDGAAQVAAGMDRIAALAAQRDSAHMAASAPVRLAPG